MANKKAGDGNRTHVSSLEGWCSTIELHPHKNIINLSAQNRNRTSDTRIFSPLLYQLSYLGIPRDTITATAQDIFYNQMLWVVKKILNFKKEKYKHYRRKKEHNM